MRLRRQTMNNPSDDTSAALEGTPSHAVNTLDLLERYHVLILPMEFGASFWPVFLEAVLMHPEPITLHCAGAGGDAHTLFQMISLIRQHGRFTGVLNADAASAHSLLFAACQTRYVSPLGSISVHRCLTIEGGQMNYQSALASVKRYERIDDLNAQIMADACTPDYGADFWLDAFDRGNGAELMQYDAKAVIEMGMAKPIEQYPGDKTRELLKGLRFGLKRVEDCEGK